MRYLFDTDALSQPLRRQPSRLFVERISKIPPEDQFTSAITAGGLFYCAWRPPHAGVFLEGVRAVLAGVWAVSFVLEECRGICRLRADLEASGLPLATADLQIAAIAISGDFVLVTGNLRHFERVPNLRSEDWIYGR